MSELLLQRTKAETVARLSTEFFRKYPSWRQLGKAGKKDLTKLLKPLGLYKRRIPTILKLTLEMNNLKGRFPKGRDEIEKLPGIGQYIANAIELFCFNKPRPLLDVNMARVLERYFQKRKLADIRYDPFLQSLSQRVVDSKNKIELNFAILDLAALVCKLNNPKCEICPLRRTCKWHRMKSSPK